MSELNTLCEVFKNFQSGKLKCDKLSTHRVKKFKTIVYELGRIGTATHKKKNILSSLHGGYLLNKLLPLAVSFLGKLIK